MWRNGLGDEIKPPARKPKNKPAKNIVREDRRIGPTAADAKTALLLKNQWLRRPW